MYTGAVEELKPDLRERTRNAVRAQLAEAALKLFVEQGFEATTVEQIAASTGLSRRSFHRYFSSKEDVLGQWFTEMGQKIAAALEARPQDEPPWFALRRAFDGLIEGLSANSEALVMTRMMLTTPALHASHLHKHAQWAAMLADVLRQRLADDGSRPGRLASAALPGAALASLESAQSEWISDENQQPLGELVDDAMNAVAPLTERLTEGAAAK